MYRKLSLVFTILYLSSCVSQNGSLQKHGYTLDYLGNMEAQFVTSQKAPVEFGKTFLSSETFESGVWACTEASWKFDSYPVFEIIELLDGEIEITWNAGQSRALVSKGDYLYIPKDAAITWENKGDVLKKYVTFDNLPENLQMLGQEPLLIRENEWIDQINVDYFAILSLYEQTPA